MRTDGRTHRHERTVAFRTLQTRLKLRKGTLIYPFRSLKYIQYKKNPISHLTRNDQSLNDEHGDNSCLIPENSTLCGKMCNNFYNVKAGSNDTNIIHCVLKC
jgi:hypothetical protein